MTSPAVLFDLDGTLVDNMWAHEQAWLEMAEQLGVPLTHKRFYGEFAGKKNREIISALLDRDVSTEEAEAIADRKEQAYREIYEPKLALIAGAEELISRLEAARVPFALATAAPAANRQMVLEGLGLTNVFRVIVGPEQAKRGKPAPDIFLAAAQQLGIPPEVCLVFEDAINGILAARAAGMMSVGITTGTSSEELIQAGALATISSFVDLPPLVLEKTGLASG